MSSRSSPLPFICEQDCRKFPWGVSELKVYEYFFVYHTHFTRFCFSISKSVCTKNGAPLSNNKAFCDTILQSVTDVSINYVNINPMEGVETGLVLFHWIDPNFKSGCSFTQFVVCALPGCYATWLPEPWRWDRESRNVGKRQNLPRLQTLMWL
jgi:hypothetical protein